MAVSNGEDPWSNSRIVKAATNATVVTPRAINVDFLSRVLDRDVMAIDESDLFMEHWLERAESDDQSVAGLYWTGNSSGGLMTLGICHVSTRTGSGIPAL